MNRTELLSRVAAGTSRSKADSASAITAVLSAIADALAESEMIAIVASRAPAFEAGKTLRDSVNREPA